MRFQNRPENTVIPKRAENLVLDVAIRSNREAFATSKTKFSALFGISPEYDNGISFCPENLGINASITRK